MCLSQHRSLQSNLATIQKSLKKVHCTIVMLCVDREQCQITSEYLNEWKHKLDEQTTNEIEPNFKHIHKFAEQSGAINDLVQKIVTNRYKQVVAIDKDALKRCQTQLCVLMPNREMQTTIRQMFTTNEYHYGHVVTIFEG